MRQYLTAQAELILSSLHDKDESMLSITKFREDTGRFSFNINTTINLNMDIFENHIEEEILAGRKKRIILPPKETITHWHLHHLHEHLPLTSELLIKYVIDEMRLGLHSKRKIYQELETYEGWLTFLDFTDKHGADMVEYVLFTLTGVTHDTTFEINPDGIEVDAVDLDGMIYMYERLEQSILEGDYLLEAYMMEKADK